MNNLGIIFADVRGRLNVINLEIDKVVKDVDNALVEFVNKALSDTDGITAFQNFYNSNIEILSDMYAKTGDKKIISLIQDINNEINTYNQSVGNLWYKIMFDRPVDSGYFKWYQLKIKPVNINDIEKVYTESNISNYELGAIPYWVIETILSLPNVQKFLSKTWEDLQVSLAETFDKSLKKYRLDTQERVKRVELYIRSIEPVITEFGNLFTTLVDKISTKLNMFYTTFTPVIPEVKQETIPLPQEIQKIETSKKEEYLTSPQGYRVKSDASIITRKTPTGVEVISTYEREPIALNHAFYGLVFY